MVRCPCERNVGYPIAVRRIDGFNPVDGRRVRWADGGNRVGGSPRRVDRIPSAVNGLELVGACAVNNGSGRRVLVHPIACERYVLPRLAVVLRHLELVAVTPTRGIVALQLSLVLGGLD